MDETRLRLTVQQKNRYHCVQVSTESWLFVYDVISSHMSNKCMLFIIVAGDFNQTDRSTSVSQTFKLMDMLL